MVKKLGFLIELPTRLQACLESNSLEDAAQAYAKAAPLLEKDAFKKINLEAQEVVQRIVARLQEQLASEHFPSAVKTLEKLSQSGVQVKGDLKQVLVDLFVKQGKKVCRMIVKVYCMV